MLPSPSPSHSVHLSLIFPTVSSTHSFSFRSYRHPTSRAVSPQLVFLQLFSSLQQMLLLRWRPDSAGFLSFELPRGVPACVPQHLRFHLHLTCTSCQARLFLSTSRDLVSSSPLIFMMIVDLCGPLFICGAISR